MAKNRYKNRPVTKQAAKSPENEKLVIQELNVMSADRSRKDVGDWRSAHQAAESIHYPNRTRLYDLYNDVLLDGHLTGIIEKRKDAVLNKTLHFEKDGKRVDELNDLIESTRFSELIEVILDTRFWGISGVEFIPGAEFDFKPIPRKHIKPHLQAITFEQHGEEGIIYKDIPNLWVMGKPDDLGLLLKCSPYALWKKGGMGDWAQYVEIFGQPVRIIKYDSYDQKTKMELRQVLDESGSSLALMIPKQADFDMKDGKQSNGNGELHEKFKAALDAEMSILILGNTETTKASSSSGYAQSKEHGKQQLEVTKKDIKYTRNCLNSPQFLYILEAFYGLPVAGGKFEFAKEIDLDSLKKRLEIDKIVSDNVPVGDDYWYNTYGIDKPDNYEELLAERRAAAAARGTAPKDDPEQDDPAPPSKGKAKARPTMAKKKLAAPNGELTDGSDVVSKVKAAAARYLAKLRAFFGNAPRSGGHTLAYLNEFYRPCPHCGRFPGVNLASLAEGFDEVMDDIVRLLHEEQIGVGQIHPGLYRKTANTLLKALENGLGGTSFDYDDPRNTLKKYMEYNIHQFSAAKSLTELVTLRGMLHDAEGKRKSFEQFRNDAMDAGFQFNNTWLRVESNSTISSAQMAFQWEQLQKTAEYIEYSTVGDDKVRPTHAALDGFTASITDQVWNKIWPPNDWECRCTTIPGNPEKAGKRSTNGLVEEARIPKYFQRNVGKTLAIFDESHPYYKNAGGKITEMNAQETFGMPSVEKLYADHDFEVASVHADKDAANEWWKGKAGALKNNLDAKDFAGNTIRFDNTFRRHIMEDNADNRNLRLSNLEGIIGNPDEVWAVREKGELKTFYLKYYADSPWVVRVNGSDAYTMHSMQRDGKLNEVSLAKLRRGILLHRE